MSEIKNYDRERASQYDNESEFDKGNRSIHVLLLKDIFSFYKMNPVHCIELGCGTGFFTKVLVESFPEMKCILVDGSVDMLNVAKSKFLEKPNIYYRQAWLQNIDWQSIPSNDLVFSALTIHHLKDTEKFDLYKKIYENMTIGGKFIYFDQFKIDHGEGDLLIEYLACRDIQARLIAEMQLDFMIDELEIDTIIANDRRAKASENDKEALISTTIDQLKTLGFKSVNIVYQEFRFFSIIAIK
ncbi:class I SAM-dependent methyltransferase [Flavobacterium oreochromis]|uniref:Methyltransferase domain-containing protein n=2 Tax=Flavobacterium TaxID=237 RepID=A0A246G8B2_9FLAO|nr:class I SAM-dependent methyltransferase [Flavobacterium oreochromis]OWP75080.1 hypothetical protein BWK62_12745 [Flavobacterium oreochromis]OWP76212.1 hypothetical protein BWG23_08780 [Flavobacterium oreochromis]POR24061.1 hypothetical protein BWK58_08785 [Flavobacterium columnare]QYS86481.1 class I SAM-dependent methyltransferase [Flavobacterium oreochromis]